MVLAAACAASGQEAPAKRETILCTSSYWRAFAMCRTAEVPLELLKLKDPDATTAKPVGQALRTDPPPPEWSGPDFDDSAWPRMTGPFAGEPREWTNRNAGPGRAMICLRGKFAVADPAAAKGLSLELRYTGGAVVYLNGREIARKHLPAGKLTPGTAAEAFSADAYVDASGKLLPRSSRVKKSDTDLARRIGLRSGRKLVIDIPAGAVRKGVNVLSLQVHRAAFRPEAVSAMKRSTQWTHLALWSVRLSAAAGVTPNIVRPKGLQVFNADPHEIIFAGSYGEPNDPLRPIRLVAPRNGECSGQVVVSRDADIEGLTAAMSDLTARDGAGRIRSESVDVQYGVAGTWDRTVRRGALGLGYPRYVKLPCFSAVGDAAPETVKATTLQTEPRYRRQRLLPIKARPGAVQSVWVTVNVPKDPSAGKYTGTLAIAAIGVKKTDVPVELTVLGHTLPDTRDFQTVVSLYQSAETIAVHYNVPLWSDKHFELLEASWRLQGRFGNNTLVVPLVNETMFGNEDSWIPWIRKADGSYNYDFTAYRRIVRLAMKHCDIRFVSYQVYRPKGWTPPQADAPNKVTVIDAAGKRSAMPLPAYGTDESKKIWGAMLDALDVENRKLGIGKDVTIVLGIGQDGGVHQTVIKQFRELRPKLKWHYGAHNRPSKRRGRTPYDLGEYLYVPGSIPVAAKRRYSWDEPMCILMSQRFHDHWQGAMTVHTMAERALLLGDDGPGRFCLDYWPSKDGGKGSHGGSLFSRWPDSTAAQRTPHLKKLSYPGPNGAIPSIKGLMFRMGLQEAETRLAIDRALQAGKITGSAAGRCRKALDHRTEYLRLYHAPRPYLYASQGGWLKLSEDLYRLAAEVLPRSK